MGHWNYRLVRRPVDDGLGGTEIQYALHEVFYDDDGKVQGWTKDPVTITGDSFWEVSETLTKAGRADCIAVLDVTDEDAPVWRKPGRKGDVMGPAK